MGFRRVWRATIFELRSLRLYWFPITTMTIIVPFSYLLIVLLSTGFNAENLSIVLPGFVSVSVFLTLVLPMAQRISNMFEDDVVELIASLPLGMGELIWAYIGAYTLLSAPAIIGSTTIIALSIGKVDGVYLAVGLSMLWCLAIETGILLGLSIRNKLKLDPLLSLLLLATIMLTPAFYSTNSLENPFRAAILANPLTHIVLLIRASIGIYEGVDPTTSLTYLGVAQATLATVLLPKIRNISLNIVEKR